MLGAPEKHFAFCIIDLFLESTSMEAEQLNAIEYQVTDLDTRAAELRRYL